MTLAEDGWTLSADEVLSQACEKLGIESFPRTSLYRWLQDGVVAPPRGRGRHAAWHPNAVDDIVRCYRARALQSLSLDELLTYFEDAGLDLLAMPTPVADLRKASGRMTGGKGHGPVTT